jgi:hypothetical protein
MPPHFQGATVLEATTATRDFADSNAQINVEFYTGQGWSAPQLFFTGTAKGHTKKKRFTSVEGATKLRLSADNTNAWGFWRIKFGGVTIHENPVGAEGGKYVTGTRYWIDNGNNDLEQIVPASIDIDIPGMFSCNLCQLYFTGITPFAHLLEVANHAYSHGMGLLSHHTHF